MNIVQGKINTPVKHAINRSKSRFAAYKNKAKAFSKNKQLSINSTQAEDIYVKKEKAPEPRYVVKIGKNVMDADSYVEAVDLAILNDLLKNPAQHRPTYNFAGKQCYNFKKDIYFDAINEAILRDAPKEEIDKLVAELEDFASKNAKYVL